MAPRRIFRDRDDAGLQLAQHLVRYREQSPLVLGLPRGGVPVAHHVALALAAPLDVWVVRKLGAPQQPEFGLGAVAEGGEVVVNPEHVALAGASDEEVAAVIATKSAEVEERCRRFRRGRPPPDIADRTVIVVDDGIATGGTMRAALRALRRRNPRRLILAVPVAATDTLEALRSEADEIVCLHAVPELFAIGLWYENFAATEDEEVVELLDRARARQQGPGARPMASLLAEHHVRIETIDATLEGDLTVPPGAQAIILFAHGSGSSRRSPRNRFVAELLRQSSLGTLLFDLLTVEEEAEDEVDAHLRFDIDLLSRRLVGAIDWVGKQPTLRPLRLGLFGASTGAAAALIAATVRPDAVGAVVSRGGRPDLAEPYLDQVRSATMLIVGGEDREVLRLNRSAFRHLAAPKELKIVPGATHLFEEPGALDQVAHMAAEWFVRQLTRPKREV